MIVVCLFVVGCDCVGVLGDLFFVGVFYVGWDLSFLVVSWFSVC